MREYQPQVYNSRHCSVKPNTLGLPPLKTFSPDFFVLFGRLVRMVYISFANLKYAFFLKIAEIKNFLDYLVRKTFLAKAFLFIFR